MKLKITFLFAILLLMSSSKFLLTSAAAQGWVWGRASVGSFVEGIAVKTDHNGNVYGAGYKPLSSGDVTPATSFGTISIPTSCACMSLGYQTLWVKYDNNGNVLWADATKNGSAFLYNITTDPSGNLIVFGAYLSDSLQIGSFILHNPYGSNKSQFYLAKISPAGTVLWAVNDGKNVLYATGVGIQSSLSGGVTTDNSGNVYVTSSFTNYSPMSIGSYSLSNAGYTNVFVAKYDPFGAVVWARSFGGLGSDYGLGITVSSSGNVYVIGQFTSPSITVGSSVLSNPSLSNKAYIAEFSSTGTPLWAQGGGGSHGACAYSIDKDTYGDVYVTGYFCDTSISFGSATITRTYPASAPKQALFIVKYSSSNTVTWSKTIGAPTTSVSGYSIAVSPCSQIWVSGNDSESVNIDGTLYPNASGNDPSFLAGFNLSGGLVSFSSLSSGGDDQNGIAVNDSGQVYMSGDYETLGYFTIGLDTFSGAGSEQFYMGKYSVGCPCCTAEVSNVEENSIKLFPNPARNELTLIAPTVINTIAVSNVLGQAVYSQECNSQQIHVDVTKLPAGVYIVRINGIEVKKFVKG